MKLISLNVGMPRDVEYDGDVISTGIYKFAVDKPLRVHRLGIEGDGQADLTVHGGTDKAVYAYSADVFPKWEKELGRPLETAELGENLTFSSLDESTTFIGSRYRLGTALLEVAQPRFPCFKLVIRVGDDSVLKKFVRLGRPGIYFRVIEEGEIAVGQTLTLIDEDPQRVPLLAMWDLQMHPARMTRPLLERMATSRGMIAAWERKIAKALDRLG